MIDLERQIRDYYEAIRIPVTIDETVGDQTGVRSVGDGERPGPASSGKQTWHSRPLAVAAASAVAVLAMGAALLLLLPFGGDEPEALPTDVAASDNGPETTGLSNTPAAVDPTEAPSTTAVPSTTAATATPPTTVPLLTSDFPIIELWSGPLLDGDDFDLGTVLREGNHAVVFVWYPSCGPTCRDGAVATQDLFEAFGERETASGAHIEFVSVVEDRPTVAETSTADLGLTLPTVACFREDADHNQLSVCLPDSPQNLWFVPVPSWTVIAPDGSVLFYSEGRVIEAEIADLKTVVQAIAGE